MGLRAGVQHRGQEIIPEEAVEIPMPHVLKDHEQRTALGADAKEAYDVPVLQHGEQLGFPLEVLARALRHLLQCLDGRGRAGTEWGSALISPHPGWPTQQSGEPCRPQHPTPGLSTLSWNDGALGGGTQSSSASWTRSHLDGH